jgi:hypothetical protein
MGAKAETPAVKPLMPVEEPLRDTRMEISGCRVAKRAFQRASAPAISSEPMTVTDWGVAADWAGRTSTEKAHKYKAAIVIDLII